MNRELPLRIQKAVAEGRAARSAYYRAISLPDEQNLGPPASEEQLATLEVRLQRQLPPSYRMFLQLHDGWRMAFGSVDLLSAEEVLDAMEGDNLLVAGSLVIGCGEATSAKLLLDPRTIDATGEWELVGYDKGVDWTYPSFFAWLEASVIDFRELAKEETEGGREQTE